MVTSTLIGLAADSHFGGGSGAHTGGRMGAVVVILCGATAGAALLHVHPGLGVLLTALLPLCVALAGGIGRNQTPEEDPVRQDSSGRLQLSRASSGSA